MACPFACKAPVDVVLTHQASSAVADLDLGDKNKKDSLSLTHLNAAMQLLTGPSNDDIHQALISLTEKYSERFPGLKNL